MTSGTNETTNGNGKEQTGWKKGEPYIKVNIPTNWLKWDELVNNHNGAVYWRAVCPWSGFKHFTSKDPKNKINKDAIGREFYTFGVFFDNIKRRWSSFIFDNYEDYKKKKDGTRAPSYQGGGNFDTPPVDFSQIGQVPTSIGKSDEQPF